MKWRLYLIFFISTLIIQCRDDDANATGAKDAIVYQRDTSITVTTGFTTFFLDTLSVEHFISNNKIKNETATKMRNFYKSRNYEYAWFTAKGLAEQAQAFWNLHEQFVNYSKDNSLTQKELHQHMTQLLESNNSNKLPADTLKKIELMLTEHFFEYANYAYTGSIDPDEMQWNIPRKKLDAVALLDSLVKIKGSNLQSWEPVNEQYRRLREQLLNYYKLEKTGVQKPLSIGTKKFLIEGEKDASIKAIKQRLKALGDYTAADTSTLFTDSLMMAVKRFQQRHGLKADGAIGRGTLQHMNVPVEKRIEQILVNMERMRWMPQTPDGQRIVVNIPAFRMLVYEGDNIALSMDIIVGKAGTGTVIFSDELEHVVFSPYWNVPPSIAKNEIVPAMRRSPGYLKRNNMEMTGTANGIPVIRQLPGGSNALGRVKFIFPNRYNIYFHDTPAKTLFQQEKRTFSHGCIRISKPFEMAKYLLRDKPEWTDEKIQEAMYLSKEKWVKLDKPIPVFVSYFTAWVDVDGVLNFREDVYGHDAKMAELMFKHEAH